MLQPKRRSIGDSGCYSYAAPFFAIDNNRFFQSSSEITASTRALLLHEKGQRRGIAAPPRRQAWLLWNSGLLGKQRVLDFLRLGQIVQTGGDDIGAAQIGAVLHHLRILFLWVAVL